MASSVAAQRTRPQWNRPPVVFLLVLGFLWAAAVGSPCWSEAADQQGDYSVVKVYDGDTILVAGAGGRRVVRLLGIDAPETSKGRAKPGQPYSQKARQHLADLVLNQPVALTVYGRDRYQRALAVVHRGNQNINLAMVRAGLAEVYRGRTPETFDKAPYLRSQADARKAQKGMWRQGAAYISPIRWKHPP